MKLVFFNNIAIWKGVIGIWFGLPWLLSNLIGTLFLLTYDNNAKAQSAKIIINHTLVLTLHGTISVFLVWLLKVSAVNLYEGWYKKENTLKELAKINTLLAQLDNIKESF